MRFEATLVVRTALTTKKAAVEPLSEPPGQQLDCTQPGHVMLLTMLLAVCYLLPDSWLNIMKGRTFFAGTCQRFSSNQCFVFPFYCDYKHN